MLLSTLLLADVNDVRMFRNGTKSIIRELIRDAWNLYYKNENAFRNILILKERFELKKKQTKTPERRIGFYDRAA